MKKKLILIIVFILILCSLGVLAYLFKTGKIKYKADVRPLNPICFVTVNVNGTSTDPITNQPIAGSTIRITANGGKSVFKGQTDNKGKYNIDIKANCKDPASKFISIKQINKNIPEMAGDEYIRQITFYPFTPITQDFRVTKPPFYLAPDQSSQGIKNNKLKSLSPTANITNQYHTTCQNNVAEVIGNNTYFAVGLKVNGILFCGFQDRTATSGKTGASLLDDNMKYVELLASQVVYMANTTGTSLDVNAPNGIPRIYIIPTINWADNVPGIFHHNTKQIFLGIYKFDNGNIKLYNDIFGIEDKDTSGNILNIYGEHTITHEFGHFIDYFRGGNTYSSYSPGFYKVFCYLSERKVIDGYGATDTRELFAEFFNAMMSVHNTSSKDPIKNILPQDKMFHRYMLSYAISQYQFLIFSPSKNYEKWIKILGYDLGEKYISERGLKFTDLTGIVSCKRCNDDDILKYQNGLMYVYAFVASKARIPTLYPVNLQLSDFNSFDEVFTKGVLTTVIYGSEDSAVPGSVKISGNNISIAARTDRDLFMPIDYYSTSLNIPSGNNLSVSIVTNNANSLYVPKTINIKKGANKYIFFRLRERILSGYWKFEGTNYDSSIFRSNGEVGGVDIVNGVVGHARFFGSGKGIRAFEPIVVPSTKNLQLNEFGLTVGAWVKPDGNEIWAKCIICKGNYYNSSTANIAGDYGLVINNNQKYEFVIGGDSGGYSIESNSSYYNLSPGDWVFVAGVWDGDRLMLVIYDKSGKLIDNSNRVISSRQYGFEMKTDQALKIGGSGFSDDSNPNLIPYGSSYFPGSIDELFIARIALSYSEIESIVKTKCVFCAFGLQSTKALKK